jgi:hypothetical protein
MDHESFYQIDFVFGGVATRLLDIGAIVPTPVEISVKQGETRYRAIGAEWSENSAEGGAETVITWAHVRDHGNHAALHGFCLRHAAGFPSGKVGTLRMEVSGGEVWEMASAVLSSSTPQPLMDSGAFETVTAYSCGGGDLMPASPIAIYPGIPWQWILQDWDDLTMSWDSF